MLNVSTYLWWMMVVLSWQAKITAYTSTDTFKFLHWGCNNCQLPSCNIVTSQVKWLIWLFIWLCFEQTLSVSAFNWWNWFHVTNCSLLIGWDKSCRFVEPSENWKKEPCDRTMLTKNSPSFYENSKQTASKVSGRKRKREMSFVILWKFCDYIGEDHLRTFLKLVHIQKLIHCSATLQRGKPVPWTANFLEMFISWFLIATIGQQPRASVVNHGGP